MLQLRTTFSEDLNSIFHTLLELLQMPEPWAAEDRVSMSLREEGHSSLSPSLSRNGFRCSSASMMVPAAIIGKSKRENQKLPIRSIIAMTCGIGGYASCRTDCVNTEAELYAGYRFYGRRSSPTARPTFFLSVYPQLSRLSYGQLHRSAARLFSRLWVLSVINLASRGVDGGHSF